MLALSFDQSYKLTVGNWIQQQFSSLFDRNFFDASGLPLFKIKEV